VPVGQPYGWTPPPGPYGATPPAGAYVAAPVRSQIAIAPGFRLDASARFGSETLRLRYAAELRLASVSSEVRARLSGFADEYALVAGSLLSIPRL
jgi:hypothetical protein